MWCVNVQTASKVINSEKQEETLKQTTSHVLTEYSLWNLSFISGSSKSASRCYIVIILFGEYDLEYGGWHILYTDIEIKTSGIYQLSFREISHNILLKKLLLSSLHSLLYPPLKSYITFDQKSMFREVDQ